MLTELMNAAIAAAQLSSDDSRKKIEITMHDEGFLVKGVFRIGTLVYDHALRVEWQEMDRNPRMLERAVMAVASKLNAREFQHSGPKVPAR